MPGPGVPDVSVTILGSKRLDGGFDVLEGVRVAADHHAVTDVIAPDAAADASVQPLEAVIPGFFGPCDGIPEVRVCAVNDDVALVGMLHELLDHVVRHVSGRQHRPQNPRRL